MTYQPDFSGCWGKIRRAKEHRDILKHEMDAAERTESHRVGLNVEFDRESGWHIFRATTFPEDWHVRWGVIIGDVAHNLRGALDHLVWQLSWFGTKGRGPSNPKIVQFPIQDAPSSSNPAPTKFQESGALHAVRPAHRAIIEGCQPYKGWYTPGLPNVPATHPFARLRDISNSDKHQIVTPLLSYTAGARIFGSVFTEVGGEVIDSRFTDILEPLKPDAEVARAKVSPPTLQRNMEVAGYVFPAIGFSDIHSRFVDTFDAIDEIAALVVDIIRQFGPLF